MITPQQTDIGRRVVYRPRGAPPKYGVISGINTRPKVFVRFKGQHYGREVNPADLEFFEPSPPLPPDRQRRYVVTVPISQDGRF
jgi:hypothetical protein